MKPRVIVEVRKGIAHVTTDSRDIAVTVIDYDVEGCPVPQSICKAAADGNHRAAVTQVENTDLAYVDRMFLQI